MAEEQTVTIDNQDYKLSEMSDKAKEDLGSLRAVDRKIAEAQQDLAILQTARNAYAKSLSEQLPKTQQ